MATKWRESRMKNITRNKNNLPRFVTPDRSVPWGCTAKRMTNSCINNSGIARTYEINKNICRFRAFQNLCFDVSTMHYNIIRNVGHLTHRTYVSARLVHRAACTLVLIFAFAKTVQYSDLRFLLLSLLPYGTGSVRQWSTYVPKLSVFFNSWYTLRIVTIA